MGQTSSSKRTSQSSLSRLLILRHRIGTKKPLSHAASSPQLPPELWHLVFAHLTERVIETGLTSIVRVCKAWYQFNIAKVYRFMWIQTAKDLRRIAWTLRRRPDLAELVKTFVVYIDEDSSLRKSPWIFQDKIPLGELVFQTISECPHLQSFMICDSSTPHFRASKPPSDPPISYHPKFFESTSFESHNLSFLELSGQDISCDSIFKKDGESSTFPFPNLRSLRLMSVWMERRHQFPTMSRLVRLEIVSPNIRASPESETSPYSVHGVSFPALRILTLRSDSGSLASLVSPHVIKRINRLEFDLPGRLPIEHMAYVVELTLGLKYTRVYGLGLPGLSSHIRKLSIEVEMIQSTPRSLDSFLRSFQSLAPRCTSLVQLKVAMAEIFFFIREEDRSPEDIMDDACNERIQQNLKKLEDYCISQGISFSTRDTCSFRSRYF